MTSLLRSLAGPAPESTRVPSPVNATPVPYVGRRFRSITLEGSANGPGSNREAQMAAYATNGTLFVVVNRTAFAVSVAEWKLWRKAASGRKEDRVQVLSHPMIDMWEMPNPFFTQQEFVETVTQHQLLTGEGWAAVARFPNIDIPMELWPVRPDRIEPVPHVQKFLAGYVYTAPDGEKVPLDVRDVGLLRSPNPLSPYRGMGAVQPAGLDLDAAYWARSWNNSFFSNGAEPSGVIEMPVRLGDAEWDEMQERWRATHQGLQNAHRVAMLEHGAKWVPNAKGHKDMQFSELIGVSREGIREAFGFPKPATGAVDDINRANAEAGEVFFARWLVKPMLVRLRAFLNVDILPQYGRLGRNSSEQLEWDFEDPEPPDREAERAERDSKAAAAKIYVDMGASRESVQEALELPAALVWEEREPDPVVLPGGGQPALPPGGTDPDDDRPDALLRRLVGAVPTAQPELVRVRSEVGPPILTSATFVREVDVQDAALAVDAPVALARPLNAAEEASKINLDGHQRFWERKLEALLRDWSDVLEDQRDEIYDQVRAAVNNDDLSALNDLVVSATRAGELLAEAIVNAAGDAGDKVVAEALAQGVVISAALPDPSGLAAIASAVARFLADSLANAAGREALRISTSGDGDAVAKGVVKHLRGLSDGYLRDQLGGALTRGQNAGRIATFAAAPEATYYASEILDKNTCKPCSNIDGEVLPTLEAMITAYGGGAYLFCDGGVRCRGTAVAVWPDSAKGGG